MRFIFGMGTKLLVWETSVAKVSMRIAGEPAEDDDYEEDFKHIPQDPHSTNGAHLEISPDAIGAYGKRKMGFSGSENAG
jgi:hypothetical protein